jgi:ABC-type nitrate/sulfonate/bicarbonate transport system ATPase subunit
MHLAGRHRFSTTEELQVITPSKLAIESVSKSFKGASGPVLALDRVSLNVGQTEFVCLVGASGCGKSTLLNNHCRLGKTGQRRSPRRRQTCATRITNALKTFGQTELAVTG